MNKKFEKRKIKHEEGEEILYLTTMVVGFPLHHRPPSSIRIPSDEGTDWRNHRLRRWKCVNLRSSLGCCPKANHLNQEDEKK